MKGWQPTKGLHSVALYCPLLDLRLMHEGINIPTLLDLVYLILSLFNQSSFKIKIFFSKEDQAKKVA